MADGASTGHERNMMNANCLPLAAAALLAPALAGAQASQDSARNEVVALDRLELRPFGGWAVTPNSVTGGFVGADAAFRLHPLFSVGGDIAWYAPFNGSEGTSSSYPLNETHGSFDLDAHLVPWPARAHAGAIAGAWEPYVLGGLGAILTRPVSVVDPTSRHFDQDNTLVQLSLALGLRIFVGQRVAVVLELRDLVYPEHVESQLIANDRKDPALWYDPQTRVTNALQVRLGASFFVGGA